MNIPLAQPDITDREIDAVVSVLKTPNLALGPKLPEFEARFAEHCHTKHAVAVSNGTGGLHLLVRAMGIGEGDEVITTPFSFVASANCMLYERAKPVFVDIDRATWNIDPALIEAAVTARTKAIIPVDVFGQIADFTPIRALADRHKLRIIEDSCEALGSTYRGRPGGSLGNAGVFGFYPNKQITTGEGGMIVTDDEDLASLCKSLRNQGRDFMGGWLDHPRLGYNYRLSDINCALGIVQLDRLTEIVETRTRVAAWYDAIFASDARIVLQQPHPDVFWSRFCYVVRLADEYDVTHRDRVITALREKGIGCSNYFAPIHLQKYMVEQFGFSRGDFPNCEFVADRTLALPFHKLLSQKDIVRICDELGGLL